MLFWLIPVLIVLLGLATVAVVLLRRAPRVAMINVETIREERAKRLKERIILQRFDRFRAERLGGAGRALRAAWDAVSKAGRRLVQRLYRLEQYYQRLSAPKGDAADPNAVMRLLERAGAFARQDETVQAEKLYIEVIGHHPKSIDAYEGLGNLYLKARQYEQARETLRFALRLQPENASVLMSLAQLERLQDHPTEALEHLRRATEIRPKNPKYLDAYVDAALAAKSAEDAARGIGLLKDVNPENQKIVEFEERLKALA